MFHFPVETPIIIVIRRNERRGDSVEFNPVDFSQWFRPTRDSESAVN